MTADRIPPLDTLGRYDHAMRVLELLRRHRVRHYRVVDERAARARLYPPARLIDVGPVSPFNQHRPELVEADGPCGKQMLDGTSEFTA